MAQTKLHATGLNMRTLRIPLRVLVYEEDGYWIARCLEFDLCGDGHTVATAASMLARAICIQLEQNEQNSNDANLFAFSETAYVQRYFAAADAPATLQRRLTNQVAHPFIETVNVRVESPSDAEMGNVSESAGSPATQFSLRELFALLMIIGILLILPSATKLFWHEIVWLGTSSPQSRASGNVAAVLLDIVAAFFFLRLFLFLRRKRRHLRTQ